LVRGINRIIQIAGIPTAINTPTVPPINPKYELIAWKNNAIIKLLPTSQ
jgi:hypothetical protein